MPLKSSLTRYVEEGRLKSFQIHDDKKATINLNNGGQFLIYMATQYIIGEADIAEANERPSAEYLVHNTWDTVGQSARIEAKRVGMEIYTFGGFGQFLDKVNFTD